jgi:hypothetical protein
MSTAIEIENSIAVDGAMKPQLIGSGSGLPVLVIFTSINQSLKALEEASRLAKSLESEIEIVAPQTVPFELPLDNPRVSFAFLVRQLEEMAAQFPVHIKISPYFCRDLPEALKRILNRNCPVVMGVRKRWWPTRDERVARKLRRVGYNVILVKTE